MTADLYVWIDDWDRFQHYKDRNPPWIKSYTELLADDEYLGLSSHQRGLLHDIWLMYASSRRRLTASPAKLGARLNVRVTKRDIEALNHAGFIEILDSSALAERLQGASGALALARTRVPASARSREAEAEAERATALSASNRSRADDPGADAPAAANPNGKHSRRKTKTDEFHGDLPRRYTPAAGDTIVRNALWADPHLTAALQEHFADIPDDEVIRLTDLAADLAPTTDPEEAPPT